MKTVRSVAIILTVGILVSGCVSRKKYNAQVEQYGQLKANFDTTESNLQRCLAEKNQNAEEVSKLQKELSDLKSNSTTMLKQLSDMSVINSTQARVFANRWRISTRRTHTLKIFRLRCREKIP